jgi:hypothetical protein
MIIAARRFRRGLKPWLVDGIEVPNWKSGPSIDEYLEQLGDEGWEVTTVTEGLGWLASVPWFTRAKGNLYHLKRRKPPSAAGAGESER